MNKSSYIKQMKFIKLLVCCYL